MVWGGGQRRWLSHCLLTTSVGPVTLMKSVSRSRIQSHTGASIGPYGQVYRGGNDMHAKHSAHRRPHSRPQEHSHAPPAHQAPLRAGTGETQEHQAATEAPGAGCDLHTQLRQVGPGTSLSVALALGLTAANPSSASLIPKPGPLASLLLPVLLDLRMLAFDLKLKLQFL